MSVINFIRDKFIFISINLFTVLFSGFLLYMVNAEFYFACFIPLIYAIGGVSCLLIEYLIKNNYYKKIQGLLEGLDKKCLISEITEKPNFCEGEILYNVLKTTNKSMNDEIAKFATISSEYREYIELWVHEIKTPIAAASLICENSGNYNILFELLKIDKFVEQVLFYSRSNNVEKDFLIKEVTVKHSVNSFLRKNSRYFIDNKIKFEVYELEMEVFTDSKWIEFILEQIISNSVKYKANNIKIYCKKRENNVSLFISDNGIGIPNKDLNRVFEKGFTGENGRKYAKSTGLGLYLCKKLCLKLGLNIFIESLQNKGTVVEIVFPKSDMYT